MKKNKRLTLVAVFALLLLATMGTARAEKEWTIMVYCAADNDLAPFGLIDINEMEMVGSTDDVNIIVQFDGSEEYSPEAVGSCRYYVTKDTDMQTIKSPVVENLGEVDMGAKKTFVEFLEWGVTKYPAKKQLVVLWNHGSGWYQSVDAMPLDFTSPKDVQDLIDAVEQIQGGGKAALSKYIASKRVQHLLKRSTSVRPFQPAKSQSGIFGGNDKAIAFDHHADGSTTALSTTDVREAMAEVREKLMGGKRFTVVSFDACLMGMVEVMHELRTEARWGIGSAKTEPGDGWPYDKFLAPLVANPQMDGKGLGVIIVDEYTKHYARTNQMALNPFHKANCTQAICDLDKVGALTDALGEFAEVIKNPALRELCWQAVINTQHCGEIARTEPTVLLQLTAHRDIVHFAEVMKAFIAQSDADESVKEAINVKADAVIAAHDDCVVHFKHLLGTPLLSVKDTHGLAVMIPFLKIEPNYVQLQFGQSNWTEFLKVFKATPQEAQALVAIMTGEGKDDAEREEGEQQDRFENLYDE